jgi:hypothetical protein
MKIMAEFFTNHEAWEYIEERGYDFAMIWWEPLRGRFQVLDPR